MGALFLPGVEVVKEILMIVSGTKIILLLTKVAFHREGGLWKMFGYNDCVKASPWR